MRIVEPPSLDSPWRGCPGDDLDRLLSDFFNAELPSPWPEPKLSEEQPNPILSVPGRRPAPRRRSVVRSRFALAASVALLLLGGWLLGDKFEAITPPGTFLGVRPTAGLDSDRPGAHLREDGPRPRIRERMILDPSGQTKFQVEVDLP